jgi:hypothetical protein
MIEGTRASLLDLTRNGKSTQKELLVSCFPRQWNSANRSSRRNRRLRQLRNLGKLPVISERTAVELLHNEEQPFSLAVVLDFKHSGFISTTKARDDQLRFGRCVLKVAEGQMLLFSWDDLHRAKSRTAESLRNQQLSSASPWSTSVLLATRNAGRWHGRVDPLQESQSFDRLLFGNTQRLAVYRTSAGRRIVRAWNPRTAGSKKESHHQRQRPCLDRHWMRRIFCCFVVTACHSYYRRYRNVLTFLHARSGRLLEFLPDFSQNEDVWRKVWQNDPEPNDVRY